MRYKKIITAIFVMSLPLVYLLIDTAEKPISEEQISQHKTKDTQAPKKQIIIPPLIKAPAPLTMQAPTMLVSNTTALTHHVDTTNHQNPIDRIRAIKEKTALHQSVLQDHDRYNRYPSNNVAIDQDAKDPISLRYEVDERTTENQDRTAFLTIWTDKKFYQRGDLVQLSAKLVDIHGAPINTQFSAQLIYEESKSVMILDLQNQGNNGVHQASFTTDETQDKKMLAGNYKLLVINNADKVADAAVFTLTDPVAAFTGEYRDSVNKDGNLIIEAEINVTEKEKLYFQASLYTELGKAIGVTQNTFTFGPGKHWVPLEFFGLMLHDSGVDGPYLLKNISLARVTMPMQRGPLLHPEYYTQAYELNQLSNTNHDSLASR